MLHVFQLEEEHKEYEEAIAKGPAMSPGSDPDLGMRIILAHGDEVGSGALAHGDEVGSGALAHGDEVGSGALAHGDEVGSGAQTSKHD